MNQWESLREVKQKEIRQLIGTQLSEVTPSIRDFAQYVTTHKQDLAVIAALKRTDPRSRHSWVERDLVAVAQECDDADVGAVAVYTEPSVFGTSLNDLKMVSAAVSAPVLCLDLILHTVQIHQARLHGADAVLLWAAAVDAASLATLVAVAGTVHVTPVVGVQTQAELEQALTAGAFLIGVASPPSERLDATHIAALAAQVPQRKTIIALNEISTLEEYTALQGIVDAVLVGNRLLDAADVSVALTEMTGG
jgi:indole-3-glycerol phosphate synthase